MKKEYFYVLKLITGETVIGKSESEVIKGEDVNLYDVYQVITEEGHTYLHTYVNFIGVSDQLLTFSNKHIILTILPNSKLIQYYTKYDQSAKAILSKNQNIDDCSLQ